MAQIVASIPPKNHTGREQCLPEIRTHRRTTPEICIQTKVLQELPLLEERMPDAPGEETEPPTPTGVFSLDGQTPAQLINFSLTTGMFFPNPSPPKPSFSRQDHISEHTLRRPSPKSTTLIRQVEQEKYFPSTTRPLPNLPPSSVRPIAPRTISTTTITTIPLKDDLVFSPAPYTPGGISREEALEQIRQRSGGARSIAAGYGTPRKPMVQMEGPTPRREISAPAVRGGNAVGRLLRKGGD